MTTITSTPVIPSVSHSSFEDNAFIHQLCDEMKDDIKETFRDIKPNTDSLHALNIFFEQLETKGTATLADKEETCEAVFSTLQSTFENLIAKKMENNQIVSVHALFLDDLPCLPLRSSMQEQQEQQGMDWKQFILNRQAQSIRKLREAGASLIISYNKDHFQTYARQSKQTEIESQIYTEEKSKRSIANIALEVSIPNDLKGEVYFFRDNQARCYLLSTQKLYQGNASPQNCWTMFLGSANSIPKEAFCFKVLLFVNKYTEHMISIS